MCFIFTIPSFANSILILIYWTINNSSAIFNRIIILNFIGLFKIHNSENFDELVKSLGSPPLAGLAASGGRGLRGGGYKWVIFHF